LNEVARLPPLAVVFPSYSVAIVGNLTRIDIEHYPVADARSTIFPEPAVNAALGMEPPDKAEESAAFALETQASQPLFA